MTKTETALSALAAALTAQPGLPAVARDAVFERLIEESADGKARALVLRRGRAEVLTRIVGAAAGERFELAHPAELEWYVADPDEAALQTAFDAGIEAIAAAVRADRTLSGAVQDCLIEDPPEFSEMEWDGRAMLTASITVKLVFTSQDPF